MSKFLDSLDILKIEPTTLNQTLLSQGYKKLARQHHPDRTEKKDDTLFKSISAAYKKINGALFNFREKDIKNGQAARKQAAFICEIFKRDQEKLNKFIINLSQSVTELKLSSEGNSTLRIKYLTHKKLLEVAKLHKVSKEISEDSNNSDPESMMLQSLLGKPTENQKSVLKLWYEGKEEGLSHLRASLYAITQENESSTAEDLPKFQQLLESVNAALQEILKKTVETEKTEEKHEGRKRTEHRQHESTAAGENIRKKSKSTRSKNESVRRKKNKKKLPRKNSREKTTVDFSKKFCEFNGENKKEFLTEIMNQDLQTFKATLKHQIKHGPENIQSLKDSMKNKQTPPSDKLKLINNINKIMQYKKTRSAGSDYNPCYSFRMFGAFAKNEKIAAADFLINALLDKNPGNAFLRQDSATIKHIKVLKQGTSLKEAAKDSIREIESQLDKDGYSSTSCFGC